jgi:hypothetical protein
MLLKAVLIFLIKGSLGQMRPTENYQKRRRTIPQSFAVKELPRSKINSHKESSEFKRHLILQLFKDGFS